MKQIIVDQTKCIGCGGCVAVDPTHFNFNDDGLSEVISNENLETEELQRAIAFCPTSAITLSDNEETQTKESHEKQTKESHEKQTEETCEECSNKHTCHSNNENKSTEEESEETCEECKCSNDCLACHKEKDCDEFGSPSEE